MIKLERDIEMKTNIKENKIYLNYFSEEAIEFLIFSKIIKDHKILDSKFSLFNGIDKIIQTTLQSLDIKFGYFLEDIINEIIYAKEGVEKLERKINFKGENLELDSHFLYENIEYFIEIKKRNNHDSTKKVGQIRNLVKKYESSSRLNKKAIMYFIDSSYGKKNHNYYINQWQKETSNDDFKIFYEEEFFDNLPFLNEDDKQKFLDITDSASDSIGKYVREILTGVGDSIEKKKEFIKLGEKYIENEVKRNKEDAMNRLKKYINLMKK